MSPLEPDNTFGSGSNETLAAGSNQEIDELLEELQKRFDKEDMPAHRSGQRSVRYKQGVGKFLIPRENTWAAHRSLVLDSDLGLHYSPSSYSFFDDHVHQQVNYKPLYDASNRKYDAYDALRENLAVLRNYMMSEFFPDGSVDANDAKKVKHLSQVADFLADGFNNDKLLRNPLKTKVDVNKANLPGSGAQYMYKMIKRRENYYSWMAPIMWPVYFVTGNTYPNWDLPDLNDSPFSNANLRMPPPPPRVEMSHEDLTDLCRSMDKSGRTDMAQATAYAAGMNQIADSFTHASEMYQNVDTLQEPTKRESIEIAKDILRKLKVKIGEALIENGLTPQATNNFAILDSLKGVVQVYEFHLHKLSRLDPGILNHPNVMKANDAIGKLGYVAKMEALRVAEGAGDRNTVKSLYEQIKHMPEHWHNPSEKQFKELLGQLESGLDMVVTRLVQDMDHESGTENWMGRTNHKAIGTINPDFEPKDKKINRAIANNEHYEQYNAQRQAAQQSQQHQANQQRGSQGEMNKAASNSASRKAGQKQGMDKLVGNNDLASMRSQMKVDPNAQAVVIKQAQIRQQAVIKENQKRQEQATRQKNMTTVKQTKLAEQRHDRQVDHREDQIAAPTTNTHKKDQGPQR